MASDKIISIGFLTERDLERLGKTFTRHIEIPDDDLFADLLEKLDHIEASPQRDSVLLTTHRGED